MVCSPSSSPSLYLLNYLNFRFYNGNGVWPQFKKKNVQCAKVRNTIQLLCSSLIVKGAFFSLFTIYGPWRYCLMRKIERFVVVLLVCYPSERLLGPAVSCNLPCLCFPLFPCLLSVFLPLLYLQQNTKSEIDNPTPKMLHFVIAENTSADLKAANREP